MSEITELFRQGAGNAPAPGQSYGGVSRYSFDSADATDSWGANDGTVNGATHVSDGGPFGSGAYSFDGTDDHIEVSDSASLDGADEAGSVSFWVSPDSAIADGDYFVVKGSSARFFLHKRATGMRAQIYDGTNHSTTDTDSDVLTTESWNHVVFTWNRSVSDYPTIYVDGTVPSQSVSAGATTMDNVSSIANNDSLWLATNRDTDGYLPGDMDDFRIYDVALSANQVRALYDQTRGHYVNGDFANPPEDGVSKYDFIDGTATDRWGTNDGTINGATPVPGGPRATGAMSFDGTDDEIELPDLGALDDESDHTFCAWVKLDSASGEQRVMSATGSSDDDVAVMKLDPSNNFVYTIHDGSGFNDASWDTTLTTGTWYFLTGINDNTNGKVELWVNGSLKDVNSSISGYTRTAVTGVELGVRPFGNDLRLQGDMDEVRVYNRVLEPWEINEIYQYGTMGRDLKEITVNKQ